VSAASFDPSGALERLGTELPLLSAARRRTAEAVAARREALAALDLDPAAAVVLFGSWGRGELTSGSDDDWLVLVAGAERPGVVPESAALAAALGDGSRGPGRSGVFGGRIFCDDLISRIGLDADSNANLTRRMLLMLESQPVAGDAVHRRCWERVLDGYLSDADRPYRPPRFFLNDLIRYWRTICVDFVGKEREGGEKWGIRNAKLRTSRKVLFAAGLVPLLQCHRFGREERRAYLAAQLAAPATDRLAAAFLDLDARDAGVRALSAYDRWLGVLDDEERRGELEALTKETAPASPVFRDVRRHAAELERGLLVLLFDTELLPHVREHGVF
jgi:predicted nucleotidyltransferase